MRAQLQLAVVRGAFIGRGLAGAKAALNLQARTCFVRPFIVGELAAQIIGKIHEKPSFVAAGGDLTNCTALMLSRATL